MHGDNFCSGKFKRIVGTASSTTAMPSFNSIHRSKLLSSVNFYSYSILTSPIAMVLVTGSLSVSCGWFPYSLQAATCCLRSVARSCDVQAERSVRRAGPVRPTRDRTLLRGWIGPVASNWLLLRLTYETTFRGVRTLFRCVRRSDLAVQLVAARREAKALQGNGGNLREARE